MLPFLFEAVIDYMFMSRCAHSWSRAFRDQSRQEDYVVCLKCGSRKRSLIQFGKART